MNSATNKYVDYINITFFFNKFYKFLSLDLTINLKNFIILLNYNNKMYLLILLLEQNITKKKLIYKNYKYNI